MYTFSVPHGNRAPRKLPGGAAGPITRLVNPGDLGEILKLFVFLDLIQRGPTHGQRRFGMHLFETDPAAFGGFGMHPHSGIATLTLLIEGDTALVLAQVCQFPGDFWRNPLSGLIFYLATKCSAIIF